MTDNEFLRIMQGLGLLKWVTEHPWSGYHIEGTCLILRQSERPNYVTEKFYWYISTKRYTIVVKTIEDEKLAEEWPKDMNSLHEEGLRLNEDFSRTPDF